ncbi:hypothetical protein ACFYNO_28235 [Kitasatospora sp. NPDC006697]|uniref:hypothetical protein n=1 Tax=Kitasatospora sp. NPDC006697 TaxID=3364020 RepID=UPI0036AA0A34
MSRRLLAAAALGIALAGLPLAAPPAAPLAQAADGSAAPQPPAPAAPHLAIAIDDGRASAVPGDRVTWKLTVRDLGSEPVTDLRIEQRLPDGAKPAGSADAVLRDGNPVWEHITVGPGAPTTLSSTADLGPTGPETLRSSSSACAFAGDSTTPLVCASHLDLLPAGRRALAVAGHDERPAWPWWTGGVLAALTAVAAAVWIRGRRTAQP